MSETKKNGTKCLEWKEFSDTSRPEYNQSIIMLDKHNSIMTGYRSRTDYKGHIYEGMHSKGEYPESHFKAWIPFNEAIAAAPDNPKVPIPKEPL